MPLVAEDFIQENSGTVATAGTSCVVSLPAGTTAGNTLVVFLSSSQDPTAPAGFALDKSVGVFLRAYRKSEVAADETSWTFTTASNSVFSWYVAEVSNVDPVEPLDASAASSGGVSLSNGSTLSTGTTPLNAALDTVVLAAFAATQQSGSDVMSWSGYTGDFEELADVGPSGRQVAVARKFISGTTGQFETTATFATSGATTTGEALIVAYRAAGSPIVAPLAHFMGFEWGTHGGMNSHNGSTNMLGNALVSTAGTWGTNYLIQAASARNGGYGLRIVQSGAGVDVTTGILSGASCSIGLNVRVVSATGTVAVAVLGSRAQLLYDADASKFGVRCGTTGTVSWQSGTTALNTWVWIDLRLKISTSTWHADWRIETAADTYTEQTAAELTGQSPSTLSSLSLGRNVAQTVTVDFDDVCLSAYYVAYPLGPHQVRLLTVDTGATVTYSGTPGNFSKFTANGTLTTLAGSGGNITTSDVATMLDEVPPTVSASADGVCQTATASGDYLEFPMAASTLAADEVIDGVRMLTPAWGGAGAGTGTVGIRGYDGTTETTLVPASTSYDAGSPTAVSSTEPRWQCAMWPFPSGGWTKTRLDAAALRFGFSTDAAPDMGCDALYLEYATHKTRVDPVFGAAGALPRVEAETDPYTLGIRALRTYTPAGMALEVTYELSGSPTTYTAPADSNPHTQVIDAPDMPTLNQVTARPA